MSSGPKTRGSYGPTSPRGQALAQKQRDAMQAVKGQDMAKKMREAYENFQKSPEADTIGLKKGGKVKKYAKGGGVSSASKRADGCAVKGKTRGKII